MSHIDLNPPIRSSRPAANIPGFFDNVYEALKLHVKTDAPPDGTNPTFVHDFPKQRLTKPDDPFDVITFRVQQSTMAPTDNAGTRVPRAPQLRDTKPHPDLAGYNLKVYGWWELAQVEFSIWARSNARADLMADWFHRFMMKYAFAYQYFKARGVDYFRFVSRADDDFDPNKEGQEVYRRRLLYEIRLETLDAVEDKLLESVDVNYRIQRQTDTISLPPE